MSLELKFNFDMRAWNLFTVRRMDKGFDRFKKRILERDQNMCQYCGFVSRSHQEIVNVDHNYANNAFSNLVTACPLCVQATFPVFAGKLESGGGVMIACNQLSQSEINGLCHVLFCAIANGTDYRRSAQEIYNDLRLLAKPIEDQWGKGLSDPNFLSQMLIDTPVSNITEVQNLVRRELRLLPSRSGFKSEFKAWAESALADVSGEG